MHINWSALGQTAAVSLLVTIAVVAVFSVGVSGVSRGSAVARAVASTCFLACAAAIAYGLYLLTTH